MADEVRCPYCHETRLVERIGRLVFCAVCGRTSQPKTDMTTRAKPSRV